MPRSPTTSGRAPETLLRALQAAHARGACVLGLRLGAFVLAEAGLLDGRPATTHWYASGHFARRFPQVKVQTDVLYTDDGDVLTSAGTAAGIDCCLHLLRRQHGAEVAQRVARTLVVAPHRQGGQAQYIEQPLPDSPQDERLADVLTWALAQLAQPHSLDGLAERALMSRRTFTPRFRQTTGTTVHQWRLNEVRVVPALVLSAELGHLSSAMLSKALGVFILRLLTLLKTSRTHEPGCLKAYLPSK